MQNTQYPYRHPANCPLGKVERRVRAGIEQYSQSADINGVQQIAGSGSIHEKRARVIAATYEHVEKIPNGYSRLILVKATDDANVKPVADELNRRMPQNVVINTVDSDRFANMITNPTDVVIAFAGSLTESRKQEVVIDLTTCGAGAKYRGLIAASEIVPEEIAKPTARILAPGNTPLKKAVAPSVADPVVDVADGLLQSKQLRTGFSSR